MRGRFPYVNTAIEIMVVAMNGRSSIIYTQTSHLLTEDYILNNLQFMKGNYNKKIQWSGYRERKAEAEKPGKLMYIDRTFLLKTPENVAGLFLSRQNISDQEDTEQWLNTSRELFDRLARDLSAVFFVLDRRGKLVWWNKQLEMITNYSKKELTHAPLRSLYPSSEREKIDTSVNKTFTEGSAEFDSWLMTKNAQRIPFHFNMDHTSIEGKPGAIGLGFEIASEEKLMKESGQARLLPEAIVSQSDTVIFVKDNEGRYLMVNPKFRKVMGLKNQQIIGKTDFDLFDEARAQVLSEDDLKVIERKKPRKFEERFDTPKGKRYYLTSKFPLLGVPGLERGVCGIATEITRFKEKELRAREQQKAITYLATKMAFFEASLDEKLKIITQKSAGTLKVSRVNIWLLEDNQLCCISSYNTGNVSDMKGRIMDMKGYPGFLKEIKSKREISIKDAQNDRRSRELTESYLVPNDIRSLLHTSIHISRSTILLVCHEATGKKRSWKRDEIAFAGAIADQVAQVLAKDEREVREQEIRDSLKEKEILLSEVHHRVKNNLAVVSSMMQLQAFEETNNEVRNKLLDSVARIKAMAIIHEQLYQSKSFAKIEFSENSRKLVNNIINIHQPLTRIDLDFKLQPLQLGMNQAIPCSLIVNETVTNILKHAFAGREEGTITFNLSQTASQIMLIIKDNGVGLPEHFDSVKQKTLGMVLIDVLARQLEAEYEFISDNGCEFRLWFEKA